MAARKAGSLVAALALLACFPPADAQASIVREFSWEFAPKSLTLENEQFRLDEGHYKFYSFTTTEYTSRIDYEVVAGGAVDVYLMDDEDFEKFQQGEEFRFYVSGSDEGTTHTIQHVDAGGLPRTRVRLVIDLTDVGTQSRYQWVEVGISLRVTYRFGLEMTIPQDAVDAYAHVPARDRAQYGDLVTTLDPSMEKLAAFLENESAAAGFEDHDLLSNVLAFTQSLPYTSDSVTTGYDEYARFPIETLAANGGDCEDTSILYATLVSLLGFGAVLLSPPSHMAVGVLGRDLPGTYLPYDGGRYYYSETTGEGYRIGDIPPEYKDATFDIIPITGEQFVPRAGSPAPIVTPSAPPPPSAPAPSAQDPGRVSTNAQEPTPEDVDLTAARGIVKLVVIGAIGAGAWAWRRRRPPVP